MSKATVVPVYFSGQNSRLFQLASHMGYTWRLSLFLWETARRVASTLDVMIGDPIPFEDLEGHGSRNELLRDLRRRIYALASIDGDQQGTAPRHDRVYTFPSHFKL